MVVDTTPMAAERSEPRLPTMEASIYSMIMVDIMDIMAGKLSISTKDICPLRFSSLPFLKSFNLSVFILNYFVLCLNISAGHL